MHSYFPDQFPRIGNKDKLALRHKKVKMLLDNIINPSETYDANIEKVEKQILEHEKPNSWNVYETENMERKLEVDFAKYAVLISEHSTTKIEEMSTFMFYVTVEAIAEKHKNQKKS